jgi:hypothetical protein
MAGEKKPKAATPSDQSEKSGRRSTLEKNPQQGDAWWIDNYYSDKIPPIALNEPRTKEFAAYRSFLIGKGPDEYNGQTLRYIAALEDEYRQKIDDDGETIDDLNEQLDAAINSHNGLQEQYKLLRDEKAALEKQLAATPTLDEKKLLEEITSSVPHGPGRYAGRPGRSAIVQSSPR